MIILVGAPEHHVLPDELVRVGDAVVALALRQDLRPSCGDARHLVRFATDKTKLRCFINEKNTFFEDVASYALLYYQ